MPSFVDPPLDPNDDERGSFIASSDAGAASSSQLHSHTQRIATNSSSNFAAAASASAQATPPTTPALPTTPTPTHPPPPAGTDRLIYEIQRLQRELDTLGRELAWSHRLATLGTLAAAAAHEVNNILTPISSYAQLALSEPGDTQLTRKALEIAVGNTQRASRIFAATLGYARDDRGSNDNAPSPLDAVLDHALACIPRELARDGIALGRDIEPATLAIHPTELQQVLLNLLLNARKALLASNPPVPRITLQGRTSPDGRTYRLILADNGPGIPAEIRDHLFEPFATATCGDSAASSAAPQVPPAPDEGDELPGTGLGLAVCRRLIEAAGGSIRVESDPGHGAAFTIELPTAG